MTDKREIRKEIVELEWKALPLFEKWAYPKQQWHHRKFHLKRRLRAEKWQSTHIKIIAIFLLLLAIFPILYPQLGKQLAFFLGGASIALILTEQLLKSRILRYTQALKLKRKLKKLN